MKIEEKTKIQKEVVKKLVVITGSYEDCLNYVAERIGGDFFVFNFAYVGEGENFREIDRFLWESRHEDMGIGRSYSNRYSGVAVIDVTAWYKRYPNEYFEAFFYFLKDQYTVLEDMFIIAEKCDDTLAARISDFFETEAVSLGRDERTRRAGGRGPEGGSRIGFEI